MTDLDLAVRSQPRIARLPRPRRRPALRLRALARRELRPRRAGERFPPSGRPRLSSEEEAGLKGCLARHVRPRTRHPDQHREAFEAWFALWNSVAEPVRHDLDAELGARLRDHYREDARRLQAVTGVRVPWGT